MKTKHTFSVNLWAILLVVFSLGFTLESCTPAVEQPKNNKQSNLVMDLNFEIKGKVKSLAIYTSDVGILDLDTFDVKKNFENKNAVTFNRKGEPENYMTEFRDRVINRFLNMKFQYNSNDKLTKMNIFNEKDSLLSETSFFYNSNEKEEADSVKFVYEKGEEAKAKLKYDKNHNPIEMKFYLSADSLVGKIRFKYDSLGNQIESKEYDEKGELEKETHHTYDSLGRLIEKESYNRFYSKNEYKYDSKQNLVEEVSFTQSLRVKDNEWIVEGEKKMFIKKVHEYYHNGYKKSTVSTDDKYGHLDKNEHYKYEFDDKGNWIKKIVYQGDNTPVQVIEREIEYYWW